MTTSVDVAQVDERDSGWEDHHPRSRVYLHHGGAPTAGAADTYDIRGVDILQVTDVARRQPESV